MCAPDRAGIVPVAGRHRADAYPQDSDDARAIYARRHRIARSRSLAAWPNAVCAPTGARERSMLAAGVRRARVARDIPYARLALTRLALRARAAVGARSHALRRHIIVALEADSSPQVVAGVASFRLDPPLSRKMLLLASGRSRGARSGRAGGAVDARIGGRAMSSVGEASTGVLGSGSERGMNGARRITVFVQWRERQTTRKRWAEPLHPRRMTQFSAPASIQTDSRASLAPRYIQTRQSRRMSRERDSLSTDQCVASPRYRG